MDVQAFPWIAVALGTVVRHGVQSFRMDEAVRLPVAILVGYRRR